MKTNGRPIGVISILGVGIMGLAQTHANGPEKNQWVDRRMEVVAPQVMASIQVTLPTGENREFLAKFASLTDLRLPCPTPSFGYEVADLTWSYEKWFWHGRHGSLQFRATVRRVDGIAQDLSIMDAFERWAIQDIREYNQGVLSRKPMNPTYFQERCERVKAHEQTWLRFQRDGNGKDWFAYLPIDGKHHLQVFFAFIPNRGDIYQSDWEGQAAALAERIFHTIRVEIKPLPQ